MALGSDYKIMLVVKPITRFGFTTVDLLVAVSIFIIIASIMIANFRQGSQQDQLRQAGFLVASVLEQAQAQALAGTTVNIGGSTFVPSGGYGVYFDLSSPNQLILFPDLNSNGLFDSANEIISGWTYNLPANVTINTLTPVLPAVAFSFRPPLGDRYINGSLNGGGGGGSLQVGLRHSRSGNLINVTVNAISGQINVQ